MARTPAPDTRRRILAAAGRLFYQRGVRAVGTNEVVAAAGTGKNLLYTHFSTKDDLVTAYLEAVVALRGLEGRSARAAAPDEPADQVVAIVAEVADATRERHVRGCALRNYLVECADEAPAAAARAFLADTRADLAGQVARFGLDHGEADRLTERLWLVIDGLYLAAACGRAADPRVAVDLARELVRSVHDGDGRRS